MSHSTCFSSGALSCAVMNTRSLLGLKNELDKFWNSNHWIDIEMDTELLHVKTFLAQEACELFLARAMALSWEIGLLSDPVLLPCARHPWLEMRYRL